MALKRSGRMRFAKRMRIGRERCNGILTRLGGAEKSES